MPIPWRYTSVVGGLYISLCAYFYFMVFKNKRPFKGADCLKLAKIYKAYMKCFCLTPEKKKTPHIWKWKFQSSQSWWPLLGIKMLLADISLQKINLSFPQQQNGICFYVRSNSISEGHIDFIQILGKITAGNLHPWCQDTQVQVPWRKQVH